jgi:hypothetical protein
MCKDINMKAKLLALTGIASAFLWVTAADAATVSIGAAPGPGPSAFTTVASSGSGAVSFSCSSCSGAVWGVFDANQITATGRPINPLPNILGSTSFNIESTSATGGTLRVAVTSQGNTDVNNQNWISSFTSNSLPTGWSVREQTFIDTANGLFTVTPGGTVTQLGNVLFNAIGTSVTAALAPSGALYSVTHLYTIVATSAGSALSTITLATPIPGALPLFATGLLGLLALRRKRKAASAKSLDPAVA